MGRKIKNSIEGVVGAYGHTPLPVAGNIGRRENSLKGAGEIVKWQ
jgi:hypothetical protein